MGWQKGGILPPHAFQAPPPEDIFTEKKAKAG